MALLSPMLGWDQCGKEALGGVNDLYQHVKFKVQKQSRGDGKKGKANKGVYLSHPKANRIRFVSSQNSQGQTPTESQTLLVSFWKALKPKQQFIKDISDKTSNENN